MAHDLVSLITVLDGILNPTDNHENPLLKSLLEKATSLKNLLEKFMTQHHLRGNKETIEALQSEIRDAAHEAEDIIESHAVDKMLSEPETSRFLLSPPDHFMSKVMEKFDAANNKLIKIVEDHQSHEEETASDVVINPSSLSVAADPTSSAPSSDMMVGFDEDALHLKHRLTSQRSGREIIPIVGMGGIGKTTLARNLYNDPLIVSHFQDRAWVTVSQDYNVRAILLGLLGSIFGKVSGDMLQKNDGDLGLILYRRLYGKRYLVVLDDLWSEKAWDEINHYLPNENHRSRILITSRELHAAKHPDSNCEEHRIHLLSSAQGWDLLCQKVFDAEKEESCPQFLKEIGQKIARDCRGLPLAISVIGGILSTDRYSKDLWEQVAKDVSSVLSRRDEHFTKILCLSYDNLPPHLKPCFLYMAAFPEDFKVKGSKLVKLWAAEGFLWGNKEDLEDVAGEYLKALVDRNLLSVLARSGRSETYSMHDLLRDLCVRKADEEKFLRFVKSRKEVDGSRRVSVCLDSYKPDLVQHSSSLSRSLIVRIFTKISIISPILSTLRLLRVLDLYNIFLDDEFPKEILELVNLRFLALKFMRSIPSHVWRFRNLQTLVVYNHCGGVNVPYKAWEISSLRHIILKGTTIHIDYKIPRVQEKLQTIFRIGLRDLLASNLINSMPNVRKLGIRGDFKYDIIDLSHLHKLETLKFLDFSVVALRPLKLPSRLKRLTLYNCTIPMRLLNNVIGALQYLEVLKIRWGNLELDPFARPELELDEGVEFCSLQYLELWGLHIVQWKVDYSHFPILRHLRIRQCPYLKEIPASIGEIPTLEIIEVIDYRHLSLVDSAKEILETQRDYGNESLQLRIVA